MEFISKSLGETAEIASNFASTLESKENGATTVGLYGDLGSGKTTFMKYLALSLGITETIQSPTFVIMKSFNLQSSIFNKLIHIDAYRIESETEMLNLDWQEIISDPKNLICIEWPEKIAGIMPPHIVIKFEHVSEAERKISIA
ncbi:MAG: tRNA (adenosine(37)-N6)-threonylcarbamoyltransferase complex ATPase subunit type 1 TsaE [Candidatus Zambryskibacteria bacterium RIFOXYC1_FULL_39_10]|uniref:tRNA threonylcarbamoyladenosine biosynthesis protein TsaE n=1 Tax=Candidatus Zambryskibacteria bacterium RIFOXYC1_FULL_39_10 TaxID=1802779 RepID=A0A1G2V039_9BACT|nr:MAG: tRNA (adenosine(37)-N6)-threonylcarbamoyltransferase complex ATPase subunit type 1 TsaE [Candidatus Zambryskibacteria bacterium RIFOXYD1_FULL_39_35]OHB14996.1 MAG: tRNA (adenosine(37)-N6)-threonylcarbamoyltransferase complex ATPase subunit type 1 TsaE [Candidatus Zambryskibacteria bacterium RIFOXYC1_FULL_39_10]